MSLYRYSKLAHGYLGNIDRTESGKQCVPWNSPIFVMHYGLHASYFPDKEIPGAVCRNPLDKVLDRLGLKHKGPWCFTNYIEEANFMESCDLPLRGQLKSSCNVTLDNMYIHSGFNNKYIYGYLCKIISHFVKFKINVIAWI